MVAEVDLNGKSVEETVAAWMEANTDTWSAWIAR
jgi:glycine betaine/proline transport system substrate-binding protein